MSHKSEEQYNWLFESLIDFAEENEIDLYPPRIITDFEVAAINASRFMFPGVINKACFFQLEQNGWKKIQKYGLASKYGNNTCFSIKVGCLFALAFLPPKTYVLGKLRQVMRNGQEIRSAPLFSPKIWSVHKCLDLSVPQTQNVVERWHNRWATLVGNSHVGVYTLIQELQKEQQIIEAHIDCIFYGECRPKQRKGLVERENRI
ncbi:8044_t:CDS:2, partial [Dentiscutata erythropus]